MGKNKGKGQETRKGSSLQRISCFDMLFSRSHVRVVSGILLVKFMNKPNSLRIQ